MSALPEIYAQGQGAAGPTYISGKAIVPAGYKQYIPLCLCRLISPPQVANHSSQHKEKRWTYYINSIGKFDYGPAARMLRLCLLT